MQIIRITKKAVEINKNIIVNKDMFYAENINVDKITLDDSQFTNVIEKINGVKEFTTDIIKVEFEKDLDLVTRTSKIDKQGSVKGLFLTDDLGETRKYMLWISSPSDKKKSSALFIDINKIKDYVLAMNLLNGYVDDKIYNSEDRLVTINKIDGYKSLIFSSSKKTNQKPYTVILPEPSYSYIKKHEVLDIESLEEIKKLNLSDINKETASLIKLKEKVIVDKQNAYDGQGMMSKDFARRIANDLNLDYDLSWIAFRLAPIAGKGSALTVDLEKELTRVNERYGDTKYLYYKNNELMILDIFGKEHKVSNIDLILNTSQTKLLEFYCVNKDEKGKFIYDIDAYSNLEDYKKKIPEYLVDEVLNLYVTMHNEKELKTTKTRLSYQFGNVLGLTHEELIKLTSTDRTMLQESMNNLDALLAICDLTDEIEIDDDGNIIEKEKKNKFNLLLDLVSIDKTLLRDFTVSNEIKKLLQGKIDRLSSNRVLIEDMAYRLVAMDIRPYLNYCALRGDIKDCLDNKCLQDGEFYAYNRPHEQKLVMGRNPLSSFGELVKFKNTKNDFLDTLGYTCNSIMFLNTCDATPARLSGCDFDGDKVAIMYDKENIIYDSVIEPELVFYNEFDGAKSKEVYTYNNMLDILVKSCGNKIGLLATANAQILNEVVNEMPMIYKGEKMTYSQFRYTLQEELKEKNIDNIEFYNEMQKLEQKGLLYKSVYHSNKEQVMEFYKERHLDSRALQYLTLYLQMCSIDESKTGISAPEHLMKIIKSYSDRPYFFRFTKRERRDKYTNFKTSVYDVLCAEHQHLFNTLKMNLIEGIKGNSSFYVYNAIDIDGNTDKKDSVKSQLNKKGLADKNMILNTLKIVSRGFNDDIVLEIKEQFKSINQYSKYMSDNRYTNDYGIGHNKKRLETMNKCKSAYDICIDKYEFKDICKAIVDVVGNKEEYIIDFFPDALVKAIIEKSDGFKDVIREISSSEFRKDDINHFKLGFKCYEKSRIPINEESVKLKIKAHSLQIMKKRKLDMGSLLEMKATYGIDYDLTEEYTLVRKLENRYLFKVIDASGTVIDEVRLTQGSKEFTEDIDELKIVVESHKVTSKNKKYDIWYVERSIQ